MSLSDRQLIRIASCIQQRLQVWRETNSFKIEQLVEQLLFCVQQLQAVQRKLSLCRRHSWASPIPQLAREALWQFKDLPHWTRQLEWAVELSKKPVPSLREVFEELCQIRREFGQLEYNRQKQLLGAMTEPIELEGIYLGGFAIELDLSRLADGPSDASFRIVALEPHPASTNQAVTHPHVSDGQLCANVAEAAINTALAEGRICDFFLVVRSVLSTYNPDSPHVRLEDWEGILCEDCGYLTHEDSRFWCEGCHRDYCQDCSDYCRACDSSFCRGCLTQCPSCSELCCSECLYSCSECGQTCCCMCLEEELCPTCVQKTENQDEEESVRQDPRSQEVSQTP